MAWDFEVIGYEDKAGDMWEGKPTDISDTFGVKVHGFNDTTGEHNYLWMFTGEAYRDWDSWYLYIELMLDGHGMSLG